MHAVWQAWCKGVNLNQTKNDSPKEQERKCNPEVCIWRVEQTLLCWFEIRLAKPVDAQNRAKTEASCKPPEPFDMRECCEAQQANQQGEDDQCDPGTNSWQALPPNHASKPGIDTPC